jgi:hypothetical protein
MPQAYWSQVHSVLGEGIYEKVLDVKFTGVSLHIGDIYTYRYLAFAAKEQA